MPEIIVTDTLRETIKKYRKEAKLRGDKLSNALKKNTSFISQLETGKLESIDIELLNRIFDEIFKDEKPDDKSKKISSILDGLQLTLSDAELERQSWMRVMDLQYRLIPIPDSIVEYLSTELSSLNKDPEDIIAVVNQNLPLYDEYTSEEISAMEDNRVYAIWTHERRGTHIKFNLPITYLSDILNKKIVRCNFITMHGIVNTLCIGKGASHIDAYYQSEDILFSHKFYTLLKKQSLEKDDNTQLAPYDIKFNNNIDILTKMLTEINDRQPGFFDTILDTLVNNIKKEPTLAFSVISKDLSSLHKMSIDNKRHFIDEYKSLIAKYETNSVEDDAKIETF